jgi:pimeloyl-ACP methyl ester carboxylesterase
MFISLPGMNAHVRDEGPRGGTRPIVLILGTASNLHTWDGWAAGLAPTRRVVRMDLLVGNSLGGGVAWLAAVQARDRVARLVLIDAAGFPLQSTVVPIGFRLAAMPLAPLFDRVLQRPAGRTPGQDA